MVRGLSTSRSAMAALLSPSATSCNTSTSRAVSPAGYVGVGGGAGSASLAATVLAKLRQDPALAAIGVECLNLFFSAVKPTPEMAKALEAEYREGLQRRADQAIYARRAAAVEQERRIKENELNTQVTLEEKRRELVDLEGQNNNRQAEYNARSNDTWLQPWRATDPRVLLALAFKMMGENAGRIGNLTITPEILASIMQANHD